MKFAVIVFPGSNCDHDCYYSLKHRFGQDVTYVWHKESSIKGFDAIVLPGGFSYGDYLRTGAIARFSPVMNAVIDFANHSGLVLGICNGFQILCEAGLLPGALMRNRGLRFVCKHVHLRVENRGTAFTNLCQDGEVLNIPIAHADGLYYADEQVLRELNENQQILFRYSDAVGNPDDASNPNGSLECIAGIMNKTGNVMGMMPHPDRSYEAVLQSNDGSRIFESIIQWFGNRN